MSVQTQIDRIVGNVTSSFSAVSEMGGTVPTERISSNLESAIRTIPKGVTLQTKTGSFTTSSSGTATVSCGFQPDLVAIYWMTSTTSGSEGEEWTCAPFAMSKENNEYRFNALAWYEKGSLLDVWFQRSSSGFSIEIGTYSSSWAWAAFSRKSVSYIAIKYT